MSNECLRMREILQESGYNSNIYAEHIDPELAGLAGHYKTYRETDDHLLIYHYSIGTDLTTFMARKPGNKVLRYHNITPCSYFEGYNDQLSSLCKRGRDDLAGMRDQYELCIADSEFNAQELTALGFKNVAVMPVLVDFDGYDQIRPDPKIVKNFSTTTNIVFVGKIAPHKAQADLVKSFYYYKKYINPDARLILVGSYSGFEAYYHELKRLIARLGLKDVIITGKVPLSSVVSYYKVADVFVSMSEHEGFCVPLLEAMHFRVPVLAYNCTAVPYTLGGAGFCIPDKGPVEIAELIDHVLMNEGLREKLLRKQDERMKYFDHRQVEAQFRQFIAEALKVTVSRGR